MWDFAETEAKKVAALEQKRAEVVARAAATEQRRQAVQNNAVKEITPLQAPGVFQVRYKMFVHRGTKTIEGEGRAINIRLYKPETLGRRLTEDEQRTATKGLRALPAMDLYWQKDVDARVQQLFGGKDRRNQSS